MTGGVWARDSNGQVTPLCEVSLHRGPAPDSGRGFSDQEERVRQKGGKGVLGEKGGQKSERPSYPAARREKRGKEEDETVAAEAGGTVRCATGSGSSCRRHRK